MIPISACIIMKNEEKYIEGCLQALKQHGIEEINIADTGSTDKSVEIARKYTDRIFHFEWIKDFAAAKNFIISKATHDQIIIPDADEYVDEMDRVQLDICLKEHPKAVTKVLIAHLTEENGIRGAQNVWTEKFFNRKYYHFEGAIHEQVKPLPGTKYDEYNGPIHITHYGYLLPPEEQKQKALRNNEILFKLLEKTPADPYLHFQIAQSFMLARDLENAYSWFNKGLSLDVDPSLEYVQMMVTGLGDTMLSTGRAKEALSLEGIRDTFGHLPEYVFMMGQIYMANEKYMEAYMDFFRCLQMKEGRTSGVTSYYAYHNIGVINEIFGKKEDAISFYKKAGDYARSKERLKELGVLL